MEKSTPSRTHLDAIDKQRDDEERTLMDLTPWNWDVPAELKQATDRLTTFELSFDRAPLRLLGDAAA
jgi:hypothetical protein